MKLNSRTSIPAFTLGELVIAMLITSLLVSLSYGAYLKFTQLMQSEGDEADRMQELRLLERELFRMTQSCYEIILEGDQLYFNYPETYSSLEFSDTTMTIVFEDETERIVPIVGWSVRYLTEKSEHIKSFQISCKAGIQPYTLVFRKSYSNLFLYSLKAR